MSISKSFLGFGFFSNPADSQPSETRKSISLSSSSSSSSTSSCLAILQNHYQTRLWEKNMKSKKYYTNPRFLVRSVIQPGGAPPPSEPPFNFINWILGVAITVVLPFFSGKWSSLLRIKNEVETAVEMAEEIVEAVEKVTEGVEKAAENIADELPEGGGLRKVVDFVEHVAERANRDAHIVGDFIDKVQEVEEKVECIVEGPNNHEHHHHKEENQENRAQKEEEDEEDDEEEDDRSQEPAAIEERDEENGVQKEEEDTVQEPSK